MSLDGASAPDPAALATMNETLVHNGDAAFVDGKTFSLIAF